MEKQQIHGRKCIKIVFLSTLHEIMYMTNLFIYGTAMRGFGNDCYLENDILIGDARTVEPHTLTVDEADMPYLQKGGDKCVHGELYRVSKETLLEMDSLEGHPDWYVRRKLLVTTTGTNVIAADAYYYDSEHSEHKKIDSGRYQDVVELV